MAYTTINKHTAHFNTKLYTGDGTATQAITGVGFQPDWTWIKCRNVGHDHYTFDAVRTNKKGLEPSDTSAERTPTLGSFDSDGFTFASSDGFYNGNGDTYVAWNWKANGAGSTNTDGSINSTATSANTTAGFSIVKYTGNGSNPSTVGHGLGAVPKFIITKRISGDVASWHCYHAGIGNAHDVYLNGANAKASDTTWNSTTPTSSVFTVNGANVNVSGAPYIAYCFAEKPGYSKFGSWTSNNNADGTFVYTGFAPSFVMLKESDGTNQWVMYDNKRPSYNQTSNALFANASSVEATDLGIDILSNGYKIRSTNNQNTGNYIYMAFGQSLVGTNDIPCTAR